MAQGTKMGFRQTIAAILHSSRYYDYRGVAPLREFWFYTLFCLGLWLLLILVLSTIFFYPSALLMAPEIYYLLLPSFLALGAIALYLGIGWFFMVIRRCHDVGVSAWAWVMLVLLWPLGFTFCFSLVDLLLVILSIDSFSRGFIWNYYLLTFFLFFFPFLLPGLIPSKLNNNKYRIAARSRSKK